MEWINVNNKTPDLNVNVLFVNINEYTGITEVRSGSMNKYGWSSCDAYEDEIFNVTHWMPLPEFPNEQNVNTPEPQLPLGEGKIQPRKGCDLKATNLKFLGQFCNCIIGRCEEVEEQTRKINRNGTDFGSNDKCSECDHMA